MKNSLVVMGVAGCGKSSVARACAEALDAPFIEGDDYHGPDNVLKMQRGHALTDEDRAAWLARLAEELASRPACVLTCSALKKSYRDQLRAARPGLRFAYVQIPQIVSETRVARRADHMFPPSLVASQFATLQEPNDEAGVLTVDGTLPIATSCEKIVTWMRAADAPLWRKPLF